MILKSAAEVMEAGSALATSLLPGDVIAISGPLGAGKTTFSRGLIAALGHDGEVPSPSFAIVQPYDPPSVRLPLLHVDLYRIDDPADIEELGLDDALIDGVVLIEWPERMGARLWADSLRLTLSVADDMTRSLTAEVPPAWEGRWPPR